MSGALTKARRAAPATLTIVPIAEPVSATQINLALQMVQRYEAQRAAYESQTIPTYTAINLTSPSGVTWQLSVDDSGTLQIAQVPR